MKRSARITAAVLAAIMLFALSGCGVVKIPDVVGMVGERVGDAVKGAVDGVVDGVVNNVVGKVNEAISDATGGNKSSDDTKEEKKEDSEEIAEIYGSWICTKNVSDTNRKYFIRYVFKKNGKYELYANMTILCFDNFWNLLDEGDYEYKPSKNKLYFKNKNFTDYALEHFDMGSDEDGNVKCIIDDDELRLIFKDDEVVIFKKES